MENVHLHVNCDGGERAFLQNLGAETVHPLAGRGCALVWTWCLNDIFRSNHTPRRHELIGVQGPMMCIRSLLFQVNCGKGALQDHWTELRVRGFPRQLPLAPQQPPARSSPRGTTATTIIYTHQTNLLEKPSILSFALLSVSGIPLCFDTASQMAQQWIVTQDKTFRKW